MKQTRDIQTPWVRHAVSWEYNDNSLRDWWQPDPVHVSTCFIRLWQPSHSCLSAFYFNLSVSGFCVTPPPLLPDFRCSLDPGNRCQGLSRVSMLWGTAASGKSSAMCLWQHHRPWWTTQPRTERQSNSWHRHCSRLVVTGTSCPVSSEMCPAFAGFNARHNIHGLHYAVTKCKHRVITRRVHCSIHLMFKIFHFMQIVRTFSDRFQISSGSCLFLNRKSTTVIAENNDKKNSLQGKGAAQATV
jgi:hypothetical protein